MLFFEQNKKEKNGNKLIITVIIISLILGGISGGAATLLVLKNLNSFGFLIGNNNGQAMLQNLEQEKIVALDIESATIEVVKNAQPAVVSIVISKKLKDIYAGNSPDFQDLFNFGWPFNLKLNQTEPLTPDQGEQKKEIGGGTGFIVSEDGLILTNKHVAIDGEAEYTVITNDGQKFEAKVLARDPINDLAVLKIEANNLKPLALGDSDNIQIGQTVIAIGNALAEFRNTVTRGVVSGINRTVEAGGAEGFSEVIEEAIQTDAAINPGNSGGPLLNLKGEVIGINTAISQSGQLVGFAIPINEAKQVIESIKKFGKIVRPYLGVRYVIINKQLAESNNLKYDFGALIGKGQTAEELAVMPGSPADKAGLVENDIILEINGQKIDQSHSLARMLARYNPGDEVELKISHQGEEKTVKVNLIERPEGK
ncbi:MAG: hypothetical protein A2Y67_02025 [Candidatus Buchananbacteria bacterium RBG_13_39_9]|uniref:PDZ domain-containing protein n=1 Tax=Candidatus Buchananbacteria bacterium RBG_13_39_9 TaxID=1797531 RepID=A0A1G1XPX6_9BACT|nr:MAG: hypothetical protein A2Y67_02025 [Candidatus Buchananbacteria bacterium RBG_13_39_9]